MRYDKATSAQSGWFRNIRQQPGVTAQISRKHLAAVAVRLPLPAAGAELRDYARRQRVAPTALARRLNYLREGAEAGYLTLAQQLPVVSLRRLG